MYDKVKVRIEKQNVEVNYIKFLKKNYLLPLKTNFGSLTLDRILFFQFPRKNGANKSLIL